jgi:uncharacterized membrane protein YedE/YeeE
MTIAELEARTVEGREGASGAGLLRYVLVGAAFGVVLVKSEAASWYRIQEMFRFQSFHMYGILGSAVAVAAAGVAILKRRGIVLPRKELGTGQRYWMGGMVFGVGWGLAGTCPGPMFALLGSGMGVMAIAILAALLGTWVYGHLREKLPH